MTSSADEGGKFDRLSESTRRDRAERIDREAVGVSEGPGRLHRCEQSIRWRKLGDPGCKVDDRSVEVAFASQNLAERDSNAQRQFFFGEIAEGNEPGDDRFSVRGDPSVVDLTDRDRVQLGQPFCVQNARSEQGGHPRAPAGAS